MTPALLAAKSAGVEIKILRYEHDAEVKSYGAEATEKLGVAVESIFKTLVLETNNNVLAIALVPVAQSLNLKAVAVAFSTKKVKLASERQVIGSTGYVLGAVSPLGQKKKLPMLLDRSAEAFSRIYVSGGRRGLEIGIAPLDLIAVCQARFAAIV